MGLNILRLHEILKQINADSRERTAFTSKWYLLTNFLFTKSGLKVTRLAKATVADFIPAHPSDLDIIMSISPEKTPAEIFAAMEPRLKSQFSTMINTTIKPNSLHVEFTDTKMSVDYILMKAADLDKNLTLHSLRDITQVEPTPMDAIKLMRHALEKIGILANIPGGQIEKAAYGIGAKDLVVCMEKLITQLGNPIRNAKRSPAKSKLFSVLIL
jgi:hypothetical protein